MLADLANALILLANFVVVPAIAYGSQLALGALGSLWSTAFCASPISPTAI